MNDIIIEAHGLKRYYHRGSETVKALDGVDVTIRNGEIVSILGPSGSGKTTLINLLSCLDAPTEGTLIVAGRSVAGLSRTNWSRSGAAFWASSSSSSRCCRPSPSRRTSSFR